MMPTVTITPMTILLLPSFKDLSLTLEQKIAINITDSRLHDLTMTTAGKEAYITA